MPQQISLERAIANLSDAIRFKTIATPTSREQDYTPFDDFILFLSQAYPLCHRRLEHTRINNYGLVYRLKGKNRDAAPLLFLAHYDIIHPNPDQDNLWPHPPFEGIVENGFVYGRGALGGKSQLIALMETAERLLESGQQPERDLYLAFSFDTTLGGSLGAARIASFFKSQSLHFDCILDGGGACLDDLLPKIKRPVALIGLQEKGILNLRVTASGISGNVAAPPKDTATTALSRILSALQENPMPARFTPILREFFRCVSPDIAGSKRKFYDHVELFKPTLVKALSKNPLTAAMVRSTLTPTILSGSPAVHILPRQASAVLRCHLLPPDTPDSVIQHIKHLAPKENLTFDILSYREAVPASEPEAAAYRHLAACASVVFPQAQAAPGVTVLPTDAHHFTPLSAHIYHFTPLHLNLSDLDTLWNPGEKIAFDNLHNAIAFYTMFILNYK